jgi:hypothetical protein
MRITKIIQSEKYFNVFLKPNLIERLVGYKNKVEILKDSGRKYLHGEGTVYIQRNGNFLKNNSKIMKAIDNFRRSF